MMKLLLLTLTLFMTSLPALSVDYGDVLKGIQQADPDYYHQTLSDSSFNSARSEVLVVFHYASAHPSMLQTIAQEGQIYSGYLPADLKETYHDMAKSFVMDGKAKEEHLAFFVQKYAEFDNVTVPENVDPKDFWKDKYVDVFNQYFSKMLPPNDVKCAGTEVLAGLRKCCNSQVSGSVLGLIKLPFVRKVDRNNCKPTPNGCSAHTECCSGVCIRDNKEQSGICADENAKYGGQECTNSNQCISGYCEISLGETQGTCTSPYQCYDLQAEHMQCVEQRPYCAVGKCYNIDKGSLGGNLCKKKAEVCTQDDQCCTLKCSQGKCVENAVCEKCVGSGAIPDEANGIKCCPGFYKNSDTGKCNNEYNPIVPKKPQAKIKPKNNLLKFVSMIFDLVIPSAHAITNTCPDGKVLTAEQMTILNQEQSDCMNIPPVYNNGGYEYGTDYNLDPYHDRDQCLQSLEDHKISFCKDLRSSLTPAQQAEIDAALENCQANNVGNTEAIEACVAEVNIKAEEYRAANGDETTGERYGDYVNQYKSPVPIAKTYSDIRRCEFHSFNDLWKDASNVERNAEIFLRSFEYIYVGEGTQDFWQDSDKGNIWSRANKVAIDLRKSRVKMMNQYIEIDRKMSCKCLATFGLNNFPANKQTFFNESCQDFKAELQAGLATNGQTTSGIDGSSSVNTSNVAAMNDARIETIDKGAVGFTYQKLLIEFTRLQSEMQMDRFSENQESEEDLNNLSEFIRNTDFEAVKKDEPFDDRGNINRQGGDTEDLYNWGRRWTRGFWRFFTNLVRLWINQNHGAQDGESQSSYHALNAAFGDSGPQIIDYKKVEGEKIDWFTKWDGFVRQYVGPKYSNNSSNPLTLCDIKARAAACLRSAYEFTPGNLKYLDGFPVEGHYIVDPKKPPFSGTSNNASVVLDKMDSNSGGLTWVQIMNKAVQEGKDYLRAETTPAKIASSKNRLKWKSKDNKSYHTTKGRDSYIDKNVMNDYAIKNGYFFPLRKQYIFKKIGDPHRQNIIASATKYATCKKLTNNTERTECNGSAGAEDDSLGFGYLFESEVEAAEWAEYTYEMHYVYSSVTSNNYIGYPLLGANFYFEAAGAKISLLEGIWARRYFEKAELADLLQANLDKKMGDYKALGEANDGTKSVNLKYSERFYELVGNLNFNGTTNLETFNQAVARASSPTPLNSSELSAINGLRNNAMRRNNAIKRGQTFEKDNSIKKGLLAANIDNPNAQKLLNPIQAIALVNKGGGFSSGSLGDKLSAINKQLANISKNQNKVTSTPRVSPFNTNFNIPSYSGARNSYSNTPETTSGTTTSTGMSGSDASNLIRSLKNNKELTERLDSDNLFTIVSKAYKRNYGRVLSRASSSVMDKVKAKPAVTDKEKEELKKLLDSE